jgi:hypothetical protein
MSQHSSPGLRTWISFATVLVCLIVLLAPAGPLFAQGGIVLDGVGDDWDAAWQVQTDGLDVFLTDTGVHPHEYDTYARSGYDATALWARYQSSDERWYFRIDVDGRAGDSDSQVGTEGNPGVGTHGPDQGPLVEAPFVDGQGLGNSEAYKLGFQCTAGASGQTAEISNDTDILPGVLVPTTAGLDGLGVYGTSAVPGVVEFAFDREVLFPAGTTCPQLWLSAQVGDNNDRVSDDQVDATLVLGLDLLVYCPEAPAVAGGNATFPLNYGIPDSAQQAATNVILAVRVPADTQFVSASDGGILAGGKIVWELGDLSPGMNGQVNFTVQTEPNLASVTLDSELTCDEGLHAHSRDECPLQVTAAETPVVPEPSTITLMLAGLATLAGYAGLQWQARRRH